MKMTVKSHLNVKYFTQKTVVLAVVSALMFIVGGFLVKEYKINALEKKDYGVFLSLGGRRMGGRGRYGLAEVYGTTGS